MDLTGKKIRNIEVRSIIGQGGVGVVYFGFDEVLQRNVALKVLRASRVDESNKLRFLREARVLSQLDHPLICRIYDTLEIEDQLVLLLEYVEGVSLAQAMIDGLSERKKFEIAGQLTQALIAAHGHGIIHRDLKPENVIVKADGRIKVLDFGLARLLTEDCEEVLEKPKIRTRQVPPSIPLVDEDSATVVNTQASTDAITEFGNVMGTVAYMSPEQAVGETLTTASDMYSLGIIFQQLFTDEKAYDPDLSLMQKMQKVAAAKTLPVAHSDKALVELITRLEEFEPAVRPRAVDVLDRLKWIRRRPYRRRRRYLIAAVVLALIAAGAKYTIDLRRERNLTIHALEDAQRAREEATQVSDFLISVFRVSEPGEERGNDVTAREILDRGADRLDVELADQPIVWARLMAKIGHVYDLLGLHRQAITVFEKVVAEQRRLYPDGNVDLAKNLNSLGLAHYMLDAYDECEALYEESLVMHRTLIPPDGPAIASVLEHLGQILYDRGRLDDAQKLIEESLEIRHAELESDDPQIAAGMWALGQVLNDRSEYAQAEALYTQAFEIFEKDGGQETSAASVLEALGVLMLNQGRYHDAESMFRRSLEIRKRVLDPGHQVLAISASYLAVVASIEGRYEEAERLLRDALAIFEEKLGPNHFNVAANLTMIGNVLIETGRYQEAGVIFSRSLAILEASDLSDNFNALVARHGCGEVARRLGRWKEAETFFLETHNGWERTTGIESIYGVSTLLGLCRVLDVQESEARSAECWGQVIELAQVLSEKEPDNSETQLGCAEVKNSYGVRLEKRGDRKSARGTWIEAHEIVEGLSGRDVEVRIIALSAEILFRLGENKEADALYKRLQITGWSDPVLDELAKR